MRHVQIVASRSWSEERGEQTTFEERRTLVVLPLADIIDAIAKVCSSTRPKSTQHTRLRAAASNPTFTIFCALQTRCLRGSWRRALTRMQNRLVFSYQSAASSDGKRPFLSAKTVDELWDCETTPLGESRNYRLGWESGDDTRGYIRCASCKMRRSASRGSKTFRLHSGAIVGATSLLLIKTRDGGAADEATPRGICVAILANLNEVQAAPLYSLAYELVAEFEASTADAA